MLVYCIRPNIVFISKKKKVRHKTNLKYGVIFLVVVVFFYLLLDLVLIVFLMQWYI